MLMLLNVHVTSVLFLIWFSDFTLTMGFHWSYMLLLPRSYALLVMLVAIYLCGRSECDG